VSKATTKRPPTRPGAGVKYKGGKRVRAGGSGRGFWISGAVVVAIGVAGVIAVASGSKSTPSSGKQPAVASIVKQVTSVPATVFATVGSGTATAAPKKLNGAPALTQGGKPRIVYIGAEYCPYCATERWAIVTALSRFGTFSNLSLIHSADAPEIFPDTQTFSFHGSTYKSAYVTFTPVETQTDAHAPLEALTSEETQLVTTYDVPPYSGTDSTSAGAIPFLYFGGKYISVGATYDPSVLQGKSASDIAAALSNPTSAIAKGAIGAANGLTAAICSITDNQPAAVCSVPAIRSLQGSLQ
jgi:hypothetical protein